LVSSTAGINSGSSSKTTSITRPVVSEQRSAEVGLICLSAHQLLNISHLTEYSLRVEDLIDCSIYLEAFEENCFEDFDLQIFSTLPDLDFLDLDVMTDLCSETTGRVILVVLEEHPLLTPEVEETKTDVELRALPEELSNSLV
jgi:hypothetical protein